jgi:hypothetical protein
VVGLLFLLLVEGQFSREREPACTSELESHAGRSLASGRATHFGQILSEVPEKAAYLVLKIGG